MPNQKKIKEVHSPHPDAAKNEVLELQFAVSELKAFVIKLVLNGEDLETIKSQAASIINKCVEKLGPTLGAERVQRTLLNTFNSDYYILKNNMKVIDEHYIKKSVPGYAIDPLNLNPDVAVTNQSIRNRWTDLKTGAAVIKDYRKQVAEQLKLISATSPIVPLNDKEGNSYKMSARNYAEMTVRHQANLEDVQRLKEEGVDLVWTSSHVDASKRCEPYQGKLYSISGKRGTTKDGVPYTPLDDALLGPKGDGNGIINGYNCRHYLIPYTSGSQPPIHYNKKEIAEERQVNERQRQYENQIRQLKLQQKLATASDNTELANRLSKRWHKLELNYKAFSLEHGRPFYRWRTVVSRDENIELNKKNSDDFKDYKSAFSNSNKVIEPTNGPKCFGEVVKNCQEVVLTDERYNHILERHPEMAEYLDKVKDAIEKPTLVLKDIKNPDDSVQAISKIDNKYSVFVTIKLTNGDDLKHPYSSVMSGRKMENKKIIKLKDKLTLSDKVKSV